MRHVEDGRKNLQVCYNFHVAKQTKVHKYAIMICVCLNTRVPLKSTIVCKNTLLALPLGSGMSTICGDVE